MERASQVGKCLNIIPHARSQHVLGEQKFRGNMLLLHQARPTDSREICDCFTSQKPLTLKYSLQ